MIASVGSLYGFGGPGVELMGVSVRSGTDCDLLVFRPVAVGRSSFEAGSDLVNDAAKSGFVVKR